MFDLDFEYHCPHCGELFLSEHDLSVEVVNQTLTCDECGNKYKLKSRAVIEIEHEVEKV